MPEDIKFHLIIRGVKADTHAALEEEAKAANRSKSGQARQILENWQRERDKDKKGS